jgi:endonuclease/exonuclease/phosphatase family metal-dependent hydrolase
LLEFVLHYLTGKGKLKVITVITVAVCVAFAVACSILSSNAKTYPDEANGSEITVVSFNTAAPWGTSFDDTSSEGRVQRFIAYMSSLHPSLIGTQELNSEWLNAINNEMTDYDSYSVLRGGDEDENKSEMNGIFWRNDTFTAVETNTFWLSQTPEKESRFTYKDENGEEKEAGCNRICSYAILTENTSGRQIAFMNTHLDNSSEEAMEYGARLITEYIEKIKAEYDGIEIILTGDFNQTDEGIAYKIITSSLSDATDKANEKATWQDWGYTDTGDKPIDFIFTSAESKDYLVLDNLDMGYVSDHYGIMTSIVFQSIT